MIKSNIGLMLPGLASLIDENCLVFIISVQPLNIESRYPTYKNT